MQHVTGTMKARRNTRRGVTPIAAWPLAVRRTQACA